MLGTIVRHDSRCITGDMYVLYSLNSSSRAGLDSSVPVSAKVIYSFRDLERQGGKEMFASRLSDRIFASPGCVLLKKTS